MFPTAFLSIPDAAAPAAAAIEPVRSDGTSFETAFAALSLGDYVVPESSEDGWPVAKTNRPQDTEIPVAAIPAHSQPEGDLLPTPDMGLGLPSLLREPSSPPAEHGDGAVAPAAPPNASLRRDVHSPPHPMRQLGMATTGEYGRAEADLEAIPRDTRRTIEAPVQTRQGPENAAQPDVIRNAVGVAKSGEPTTAATDAPIRTEPTLGSPRVRAGAAEPTVVERSTEPLPGARSDMPKGEPSRSPGPDMARPDTRVPESRPQSGPTEPVADHRADHTRTTRHDAYSSQTGPSIRTTRDERPPTDAGSAAIGSTGLKILEVSDPDVSPTGDKDLRVRSDTPELPQTTAAVRSEPTPPRALPMSQGPVTAQIVDGVKNAPGGTIELSLVPEELGRVRLTMQSSDAGLVVVIHAERAETAELLRRHVDVLARELGDEGFDQTTFSFAGGDGASADGREFRDPEPEPEMSLDTDPHREQPVRPRAVERHTAAGRLDLRF